MFKKTLPLFLLFFVFACTNALAQNLADSGYYYQSIGSKETAASFFEQFIANNPDNHQVRLDLAYLYRDMGQTAKAKEQFEYVARYSSNNEFVQQANYALNSMNSTTTTTTTTQTTSYSGSPADSGYYYYNNGNKTKAAMFFEEHLRTNSRDTKVRMQLAYIYYGQKKYSQALKHFDLAGRYATDPKDREAARSAALVLREQMAGSSARSLDVYFHSFYDTYQENFIANLVMHLNFRLAPRLYAGPYLDVYTDTRSSKALIYNDRFIELGLFMRYYIMDNLFFEGRIGYARQLDLDSNKINIKPMLVYFNRFGEAKPYVTKGSGTSRTSLYLDIYYAAMYDYKYKNAYLQGAMQQVLRFHTGGYGYVENYLFQAAQFDGRKLDYNNYFEVGTGLRFKPNVPVFPVLFVEPSYKLYFFGDRKGSFQIKAGLTFNFRTKL